jgi:hypothetical protein
MLGELRDGLTADGRRSASSRSFNMTSREPRRRASPTPTQLREVRLRFAAASRALQRNGNARIR